MTGSPRAPLAVGSLVLAVSLTTACAQGRARPAPPGAPARPPPRRRPPRPRRPRSRPPPTPRATASHGHGDDHASARHITSRPPRPPSLPRWRRCPGRERSPRCASPNRPRWAAAPTRRLHGPRLGVEPDGRVLVDRGCPVGRSGLRYVTVNFWGFDGKRSRGALVVNRSVAGQTAAAFSRLYDLRFRIRQMRPMDSSWGATPRARAPTTTRPWRPTTPRRSTAATSAARRRRRCSRHAYGLAIDVNDFENPTSPRWRDLSRRLLGLPPGPGAGVFSSSSSAAVRAFTSQGMRAGCGPTRTTSTSTPHDHPWVCRAAGRRGRPRLGRGAGRVRRTRDGRRSRLAVDNHRDDVGDDTRHHDEHHDDREAVDHDEAADAGPEALPATPTAVKSTRTQPAPPKPRPRPAAGCRQASRRRRSSWSTLPAPAPRSGPVVAAAAATPPSSAPTTATSGATA